MCPSLVNLLFVLAVALIPASRGDTDLQDPSTKALERRASRSLLSNTPVNDDVLAGKSNFYSFPAAIGARDPSSNANTYDSTELKRRSDQLQSSELQENPQRAVYITINTCQQPVLSSAALLDSPPQLTLYVSTTPRYEEPDATSPSSSVIASQLVEGYASITVNSTDEIYIGVSGPQNMPDASWNFNLAASVDGPYQSFVNATGNLFMIDSDPSHALLITKQFSDFIVADTNRSQEAQSSSIFVLNADDTAVKGLSHSYCGLRQLTQQSGYNSNPDSISFTPSLSHYLGDDLEQQFFISNLNASSTYNGYLTIPPNSSSADTNVVGGGGTVYAAMNFTTKRYANCAVIYNLSFCSGVAYAVPANPARYPDMASLAALYDNTTQALYSNFDKSLQQIACDTTATAQYSLVKTCNDCAEAYKNWLCAVSIPRCADWLPDPATVGLPWLQPRNAAQQPIAATPDISPVTDSTLLSWLATNSSRNNATIAGDIAPGPYSEILPCKDLCYELVRSCPAALGFACPMGQSNERGYNRSYGLPGQAGKGGLSCSEPGSVYGANSAVSLAAAGHLLWIALIISISTAIL